MKFTTGFVLLVSGLLAAHVTAAPSLITNNSTYLVDSEEPTLTQRQNGKVALRILPLGASIVRGGKASDQNGFRKFLRDQLRFKGWEVNMVGSKQLGTMKDNNHEGTSGAVIAEINGYAKGSYMYKPNLVVINAGTNDANKNLQEGAGARMEEMLNDIWKAAGMGKTAIVVTSVLTRRDAQAESNRQDINRQLAKLVARLQTEGRPIWFQTMPLTLNHILPDNIHPTGDGFKLMAKWMWIAIESLHSQGKIPAAEAFDAGTSCGEKVPGNAVYGGLTQKGSGVDDGLYYHDSQSMGTIWSYTSEFDRGQWFFPQLFGRKRADLVGWWIIDGVVSFATWRNSGDGNFVKISDMSTNLFCNPKGVWFVDLNDDGYDDFLCVAPNGDTQASINNKDGNDSKPPTFTFVGVIKANEGYAQERVHWADIDGDGRADYVIIDNTGNMWAWRNAGIADKPEFWQKLGMRRVGYTGEMSNYGFGDINGDGRDDVLSVDKNGAVFTFINNRSCKPGVDGDGLNIAWRQGFWKGATAGPTHARRIHSILPPSLIHVSDRSLYYTQSKLI